MTFLLKTSSRYLVLSDILIVSSQFSIVLYISKLVKSFYLIYTVLIITVKNIIKESNHFKTVK